MYLGGAYDDDINHKITADNRVVNVNNDSEFISEIWGNVSSRLKLFFPVFLGGDYHTNRYNATEGPSTSYANTSTW
jgi:hypothetical protein